MASVNKVILIGNLTRDPELRYTPKGSALCEVGLAVSRKYKLDSGEQKEEVAFLDVVFWGKPAEIIAKWMKKGRPLYVEGRLQMDTWDDKTTGQKRSKIRIVAEEFQFLGDGGGGAGGGGDRAPRGAEDQHGESARSAPAPQRTAPSGQSAPHNDEDGPIGMDEDDIPF